ncbi:uncharacterized protein DS421_15g511130 [Arachis hypogaea]|nr:uncharacterized protein DS421_15g511130 [Arachis hypogaea]
MLRKILRLYKILFIKNLLSHDIKSKRLMARNNVKHVTAMLIIGVVICSAIAEIHTSQEWPWTPVYYVASTLQDCLLQCRIHYHFDERNFHQCILNCYATVVK